MSKERQQSYHLVTISGYPDRDRGRALKNCTESVVEYMSKLGIKDYDLSPGMQPEPFGDRGDCRFVASVFIPAKYDLASLAAKAEKAGLDSSVFISRGREFPSFVSGDV